MCDLNELALENMLSYIRNEIKPDVVIWGGDSIPHNTESVNTKENIEVMEKVTKQVIEGLPGIKIYPTIGNHDTYPQDVISMREPQSNYVINQWAQYWEPMIGKDPE